MKIALNIVRVAILLLALLFLVMGMQWLFVPQNMGGALIPNGILGWATLRADFGSFFMVAGITAALAASNRPGANHYLFCCILMMMIAALGRLIGFFLDGIPEGGITPLIFELVTSALLVALASLRSRISVEVTSETVTNADKQAGAKT
jgi:hypothetical protein